MRDMWTTAMDDPGCLSVSIQSVIWTDCAKVAERINVLFRVETPWAPGRHCVRWGSPYPHSEGEREGLLQMLPNYFGHCLSLLLTLLSLTVGSVEVRSPRPPHIKFRVGQVIRHKRFGYRGVIIGWDAVARVSRSVLTFTHFS